MFGLLCTQNTRISLIIFQLLQLKTLDTHYKIRHGRETGTTWFFRPYHSDARSVNGFKLFRRIRRSVTQSVSKDVIGCFSRLDDGCAAGCAVLYSLWPLFVSFCWTRSRRYWTPQDERYVKLTVHITSHSTSCSVLVATCEYRMYNLSGLHFGCRLSLSTCVGTTLGRRSWQLTFNAWPIWNRVVVFDLQQRRRELLHIELIRRWVFRHFQLQQCALKFAFIVCDVIAIVGHLQTAILLWWHLNEHVNEQLIARYV